MEACNSTVGAAHGAVNSKTCTQCGKTKPLEDFRKGSSGKLGGRSWCKSCKKEYDRKWQAENRDKRRESSRKWLAKNRDKNRESNRKWRAENPEYGRLYYKENGEYLREYALKWRMENKEKYDAYVAVGRALYAGSLVRPDRCSQCGKECKPDAHHDDYSKPLEVRWLCRTCHKLHHSAYEKKETPC